MRSLSYSEAMTLEAPLQDRRRHVQKRYTAAWERYCVGTTPGVRVEAGELYCRLKDAWEYLTRAHAEVLAVVVDAHRCDCGRIGGGS